MSHLSGTLYKPRHIDDNIRQTNVKVYWFTLINKLIKENFKTIHEDAELKFTLLVWEQGSTVSEGLPVKLEELVWQMLLSSQILSLPDQ